MKKALFAFSLALCCNLSQAQDSVAANQAMAGPITPPIITSFFANPSVINRPGNVNLYWSSLFSYYCQVADSVGGPNGMKTLYVPYSRTYFAICSGQYGSTASATSVAVRNLRGGETSDAGLEASFDAHSAPDLRHFGLHPRTEGQDYARLDLDGDGKEDLLVLDKVQQQLHLILAHEENRGQKRSIAFKGDFRQLRSISLPRDPLAPLQITTNW